MNRVTKASILAGSAAFITANGLIAYIYSWFDWPTLLVVAVGFGSLAAVVSFCVTRLAISKRFGRSTPVLGAMRGAAIAILSFIICLPLHAAVFPGATGFFPSLAAQLVLGLLLFGCPVALVGAVGGFIAERFILDSDSP